MQAKDLLQKLMHKDPTKRMTLQEMQNHPWLTGASIMNNSIIRRASSAISDQLMARKAELPPAQGEDEVRPSPREREESPADRMSGSGSAEKRTPKKEEEAEERRETKGEGDEATERIETLKGKERDVMELQAVDEGQPDPTHEPLQDMSVDSLATMERVTQPRRASRSLVAISLTAEA